MYSISSLKGSYVTPKVIKGYIMTSDIIMVIDDDVDLRQLY
jgi:hypothetical protein